MSRGPKFKTTLSEDLDVLLDDLCIDWGFCNQLDGEKLIRQYDELTPADFASAVLAAENMDPAVDGVWQRKLQARFKERYGDAVSVETFRATPD